MKRWLTLALSLALVLNTANGAALASSSAPPALLYFAGSGPPCTVPAPAACPDVAVAPNGDSVAISGAGSITQPKSATGSGTFVHRDAAGNIRGRGTWTASDLISFHFYGCGVDASGNPLPDFLCGGQALIAVHLVADGGFQTDGVLTVDCEIGPKVPGGAQPGGAVEGVTLLVPGIAHFNKSASGFTVFLLP